MTTTTLKLFALIFMVIDHLGYFIPQMPIWFRWIGRLSAPIFIFCMSWGFHYTKDKWIYIIRMYLLGVGMALTNVVLNSICNVNYQVYITNNFFSTLFVICSLIFIIEAALTNPSKKHLYLGVFFIWQLISTSICICFSEFIPLIETYNSYIFYGSVLGNIFYVEGGIFFIVLGLGLYFLRNNKKKVIIFYCCFCLFYFIFLDLGILSRLLIRIDYYFSDKIYEITRILFSVIGIQARTSATIDIFFLNYQWMMIGALPFILFYNNKKGKQIKYLFYYFYPLHIFVLYCLGNLLTL